jgi:hypothetical protein
MGCFNARVRISRCVPAISGATQERGWCYPVQPLEKEHVERTRLTLRSVVTVSTVQTQV